MYIRRLPWSYNPLAAPSGLMGYSAHVTSVGTRHGDGNSGAAGGESAWTSVSSRPASGDGTGTSAGAGSGDGGGGQGQEMSFDELLALSIAVSAVSVYLVWVNVRGPSSGCYPIMAGLLRRVCLFL